MIELTTDQVEMIHYYYNLLNTIEEGFDYVIESFANLELTEGDKIFKDILSAFYHVDSSHSTLKTVLEEEVNIVESILTFDQVILTLDGQASIFTSLEHHHDFVKNQLAPAYIAWKDIVQTELKPYITQ